MRDEIDARLWNDHHEAFSSQLKQLFSGLRRLAGAVPMPVKVMSAMLAASVAALTAPPPFA